MFEYLEKFNKLPAQIKQAVSGPEALKIIEDLEQEYGVELAAAVMRVMAGEVAIVDLPKFFIFEFNLDGVKARVLSERLKEKIFSRAADYLGLSVEKGLPIEAPAPPRKSPPAPEARGSAFFFSPEDEEEVRTLAQKINLDLGDDQRNSQIEAEAKEVLAKTGINFASAVLAERCLHILRTYVNDIRDKIETKESLTKPPYTGGVGLESDSADKAIAAIESLHAKFNQKIGKAPSRIKVPEDNAGQSLSAPAVPSRDIPYDFQALKDKDKTPAAASLPETSPTTVETKETEVDLNPSEAKLKKPIALPSIQSLKIPPSAVAAPVESGGVAGGDRTSHPSHLELNIPPAAPETISRPSQVIRRAPAPSGKKSMEDIKYVPKIVGPLEELKIFDALTFRRLSREPDKAADKLTDKLANLETESFGKRREGVRAWRNSPLFRLYLAIGLEALNQNRSVGEIMQTRAKAGLDYLTDREFSALAKFNQAIRFH